MSVLFLYTVYALFHYTVLFCSMFNVLGQASDSGFSLLVRLREILYVCCRLSKCIHNETCLIGRSDHFVRPLLQIVQ